MPAGGRPTVRSRRLGAALKRHRLAAGMDQAGAAEVIKASTTRVSRIEGGQVSARALEVDRLLMAYGVEDEGERRRLDALARVANQRGWWQDYGDVVRPGYADHISLENDATAMRVWHPSLMPGLLQTPAYAEAVISAGPHQIPDDRVSELTKVREERQKKIEEGGATFAAVIWEPVIHALASGGDVGIEQLRYVLEVMRRKNVTVQLLPLKEEKMAGSSGPFTAFSFGPEPIIEAVTLNTLTSNAVLEDPDDLGVYLAGFDALRSVAMGPDQTASVIREVIRTKEVES
ncbi:helix-turn-helix domain-containing protein [Streptomyces smyrnaeus]|uniref:helix-turn-helix domain-containing protein n=1 Tax=Streptomyces smyrnaeus TaxID=1387713 RepID=UPI0036AA8417